jgi:hypothetical protein
MARVPVNDKILERARELIKYSSSWHDRAKLRRIIDGEVKGLGSEWWRKINNAANRDKLEKIRPMADPACNPNEHQRRIAEERIAKLEAASPPGLDEYDRRQAERLNYSSFERELKQRIERLVDTMLPKLEPGPDGDPQLTKEGLYRELMRICREQAARCRASDKFHKRAFADLDRMFEDMS